MTAPALDSRVSFVTVYRTGARVIRVAEITRNGSEFPAAVRVAGLPLCLDDGSVRVRVIPLDHDGAAPVAADLRVVLELPRPADGLPSADDADVKAARAAVMRQRATVHQLERELARLMASNMPRRPDGADGKPPIESPTAVRLAMTTFLVDRARAATDELHAARKVLDKADRALERAREADRVRTGARQTRSHELRKTVVIGLRDRDAGQRARLELEYAVPGARWAPAYSVRFDPDMGRASLSLRAVVAQHTGEDWTGVGLSLSTAEPSAWTELPELTSVRIGKRQPALPKAGWRSPPAGAEALYADYDRAFESLKEPPAPEEAWVGGPPGGGYGGPPREELATFMDEEDAPVDGRALGDTGSFAPPPAPQAAEQAVRFSAANEMVLESSAAAAPVMRKSKSLFGLGGSARARVPEAPASMRRTIMLGVGGGAPDGMLASHDEPVAPRELRAREDLLGYGTLRMGAAHHSRRGELSRASEVERYLELLVATRVEVSVDVIAVIGAARRVADTAGIIGLPEGHHAAWTGHYDYAYVADHPVDVTSGDGFHSIPVVTRDTTSELLYVAVPRESSDVFRTATVHNCLASPLLAGPVDIYVGDAFLLTSSLDFTAPGSGFVLGLGVEQAIKLARNTRFREETAGLLGGSLSLHHNIHVEIQNRLERDVHIEVRDRVPVTRKDEEDIKVVVAKATPPWEEYEPFAEERGAAKLRGGHRWRTHVAAGAVADLRAAYTVELSSKLELVGGNRRED